MAAHPTACILCSRNCGLLVETDGPRFARIRGDESSPATKGYICQKAARLTHYQAHDDRLQHPLKRQPDGRFERVGWGEALRDIARRLNDIKARHGGKAFAFYGGGGQGNHLGGTYGRQLLKAMGSHYFYNALGQEKTGDFWVNGRLFGRQTCHTTEDVEHADFVLFIGTNPFQSHGIPNARDTLRHIQKDPRRTMVVVDPRRTETAAMADLHLPIRPGTDAFLMAAMLAIMVRRTSTTASSSPGTAPGSTPSNAPCGRSRWRTSSVARSSIPRSSTRSRADSPPHEAPACASTWASNRRSTAP